MAETISDQSKTPSNFQTGSTATPGQPQRQLGGTGFTNLQKYLQSNTGNQLGQAVSSGVQNVAGGVSSGVQQAKTQFNTQSQEAFQPFQGASDFTQQTIKNAAQSVQDPSNIKRFQTITSGQYSGPTGLNNLSGLQAGAQTVNDLANLARSSGGQSTLLGTFLGSPTYSTGQRGLDTLLLGQGDLSSLRQMAGQTNRQLANASGYASTVGQTMQQQANQLGQEARSSLSTEKDVENKTLQDALVSAQKQEADNQALFQQAQNALQQGMISKKDAERLGLGSIAQSTPIYNLDLSKYINTNISQMPTTVSDIASQSQAAQLNALGLLGGQTTPQFDVSKVGTYKPSSQTFESEKFLKDQAAAQAAAEAAEREYAAQRSLAGLIDTRASNGLMNDAQRQNMIKAATEAGMSAGGRAGSLGGVIKAEAERLGGNYYQAIQNLYNTGWRPESLQGLNALRSTLQGLGVNPDNFSDVKTLRQVDEYGQ